MNWTNAHGSSVDLPYTDLSSNKPMTDTTYQGWTNYETWNVALWIGNDQDLYNVAKSLARRGKFYQDLVEFLYECGSKETPDGVKWNDPAIDAGEVTEMMDDL